MKIKTKIRKAIIPAAGLGTRFLPATKAIPKEMIPIVDKPMIQYIVEECVHAGIEDVILITARGKSAIEDHFDHSFEIEETLKQKQKDELWNLTYQASTLTNLITIRQKIPLGLGHAVLSAQRIIGNEPFAVLLGDDLIDSKVPCIQQLIQVYEEHAMPVIGIMEVLRDDVHKYGIIDGEKKQDRLYRVRDMVEKPSQENAPSTLACPGRYVLTPEIFDHLQKAQPGAGGEIQLTDALAQLARSRSGLLAYQFEGKRYDAGDKQGFIEANLAYALKRPELRENILRVIQNHSID